MAAEAMVEGHHIRCPYCAALFPQAWPEELGLRHDEHPHGCPSPLPDPDEMCCYSCGRAPPDAAISRTQSDKYGGAARCKDCVDGGKSERWMPSPPVHHNAALHEAISAFDVSRVEELLRSGVDPNCPRQAVARDDRTGRRVQLFMGDGTPLADEEPGQPTTPLRLVVFRISDCLLGVDDLAAFRKVAELLLAAGADASSALEYASERYGDWAAPNGLEDGAAVDELSCAFRAVLNALASSRR
mmetsp:Transcript_63146/g.152750  ORF Transcript_63146/g.152750 Transcript_63146/m.152750 type:complete len:243 (+) Transcript_63146:286-1014(+)